MKTAIWKMPYETSVYNDFACFKMLLPELIQILMLMFLYEFHSIVVPKMENGCTFLVAHGKHFEFQFLNYKLSHEIKSAKENPWQKGVITEANKQNSSFYFPE